MPVQKPGRSKQDYGTPWDLIHAVEARWGKLTIDLAANEDGGNAKASRWLWDSLSLDWCSLLVRFNYIHIGWLNPPFANIGEWAAKCAEESKRGADIIMLTPASIGTEWFAAYVEPEAAVVALRPRLTFEGCTDPYPKDCMLTLWGQKFDGEPQFSTWRWR